MPINDQLLKNHILEGLSVAERDLIAPCCEIQEMLLGDVVEEAGRAIHFLHFPIDSAISVTNVQDQEHMVEVTVTGKEGCAGSSVVLGSDRSPCMALVQIGGSAIRISTADVMDRLPRLPYLRAALARYNLLLLNLAVISVGCSQFHPPSQRVARWLKTHWHRTGIQSFPFSDAFLAAQVGVDSKVVSEVLDEFQDKDLVKRGRNQITIIDHDVLERHTCRCYTLAKESTEHYKRGLIELAQGSSS